MAALGVKVSHERLRQLLGGNWSSISRGVRRNIRTYNAWKRPILESRDDIDAADAGDS